MLKKIHFLTLFFSVIFTIGFANDSFEGKKIAEVSISIENLDKDTSYDVKAIANKLKAQKGSIFLQSDFDADLKTLTVDFDRIDPDVEMKNNEIFIKIKLWLRPMIRKIEWIGNQKFKSNKLQKELAIKVNTAFNVTEFNKALNKVKEFYIKKGYFESQITYKVIPISDKNEVKLQIKVKEGKSGKIQKIVFKGFTKSEKNELLSLIITKKYNILTSWMTGTGTFREDAIEQDKMSIINFLQNKGYADAKADINITEDKKSGKLIIEITAHRGTLYRFGKITYDGNCILPDEDILKRFLVYPNDPFSPEKIRETIQAIKDAYGAKGYIETHVYYETQLMENEPIYNINFYIDEGDVYKIGLIKIYGNKSTRNSVILRESLLIPGETFDTRKLKATQARLENLGYFKAVNVYAVQASDDLGCNYRDVHIEVEETSTGHLSFAAGYSSSENITGTIDLTENNFDHRGIFNVFKDGTSALRGGGEYLQLKASLGKRQQNAALTWMTPHFKDSLWRAGFEISGTSSSLQSKDYKVRTFGGSVYTAYPISTFWNVGTRYRLRNSDNIIKKKKIKGKPKNEREEFIKNAQKDNEGLISGLGLFLNYDSTDSSYKPHRGLKSNIEGEYVGIGGEYDFLKYSFTNSYYYPLWSKGTFKYRLDLKFIDARGKLTLATPKKVPLSERFFLGGETTVRGYKPYIIGPKMPGKPDDPFGGTSSTLLSIEYNQEIIRPLVDLFLFVDSGSVKFDEFKIGTLRTSVGAGLRLEIMNRVPITVGWGYPINPKKRSTDSQSVFFYMGGQF
ncbi:MAG: outer membrane protein assembly factor BamA [Parachlamydiales bacterium]|nr:outer membrane protein assembly factor BamA [Parachlamydiales bacterium]